MLLDKKEKLDDFNHDHNDVVVVVKSPFIFNLSRSIHFATRSTQHQMPSERPVTSDRIAELRNDKN